MTFALAIQGYQDGQPDAPTPLRGREDLVAKLVAMDARSPIKTLLHEALKKESKIA